MVDNPHYTKFAAYFRFEKLPKRSGLGLGLGPVFKVNFISIILLKLGQLVYSLPERGGGGGPGQ